MWQGSPHVRDLITYEAETAKELKRALPGRHLVSIPGVEVIGAMATQAFAPPMELIGSTRLAGCSRPASPTESTI